MSDARIGFSEGAGGRTTAARRLGRTLSDLWRGHEKRTNPGKRTGWWRDSLRSDQSRSGKARVALGKTNGNSSGGVALLVHLRTAAIDLQSLHWRDRDFLYAFAEQFAAGAL